MHGSPLRFTTSRLFYLLTLTAASVALFREYGVWVGLAISAFVALVWAQVLMGVEREATSQTTAVRPEVPVRKGVSKLELLLALVFTGAVTVALVRVPSDVDPMQHAEISLRSVAKALGSYHALHGELPPQIVGDEQGRATHSWRVLLLPQLGEDKLAEAYDYSQPFDSPWNRSMGKFPPWQFQLHYPRHSWDKATTSVQFVQTDDCVCVFEHEQLGTNWLAPSKVPENAWEVMRSLPATGEGFWRDGFFSSSFRGRVAVVFPLGQADAIGSAEICKSQGADLGRSVRIFPETQAVKGDGFSAHQAIDGWSQLVHASDSGTLGQPLVIVHYGNALRLVFFLAVALYPIRWLRKYRD